MSRMSIEQKYKYYCLGFENKQGGYETNSLTRQQEEFFLIGIHDYGMFGKMSLDQFVEYMKERA